MNIKEYILQVFSEDPALSEYDVSEGSAYYDLIVSPMLKVLDDGVDINILQDFSAGLDITNYKETTIENLQNLGENYSIAKNYENVSFGYVDLYFNSAVDWLIPANTEITSLDTTFYISATTNITEAYLKSHREGSNYVYTGLKVYSPEGTTVSANVLNSVEGSPLELIKIKHPSITNGTRTYTKEDYYGIISQSLNNRQLINKNGIQYLAKTQFPNIRSIDVVGKGDVNMERDVLYNMSVGSNQEKVISDFSGKILFNIKNNASKAFVYLLSATEVNSEILTSDTMEILQVFYNLIGQEDGAGLTVSTENIMHDNFNTSSSTIGEIETIPSAVALTDTSVNVEDYTGFLPGTVINIIGTDGESPTLHTVKTQRKVEQTVTVSGSTITLSEAIEYLKVGGKVSILGSVYTVLTIPTSTTITVTSPPTGTQILDVYFVDTYTPIGTTYTAGAYFEIVEGEGFLIGNGWVKSEHAMPVGKYLNPREVMVENNQLVLGNTVTSYAGNYVREVISKAGIESFVKAITDSVSLVLNPVQQVTNNKIIKNNDIIEGAL